MKGKLIPLRLNELLGCSLKETIQSQIFRSEARVLCDTGEHLRANLFFIMKGEYYVRPAGT
jgi:hypothetical protein